MTNFQENKNISIQIGGALTVGHCFVEFVHGTIKRTTEKAILVNLKHVYDENRSGDIWLPKKALKLQSGKESEWYVLARWFKTNEYQNRIFDKVSHVS